MANPRVVGAKVERTVGLRASALSCTSGSHGIAYSPSTDTVPTCQTSSLDSVLASLDELQHWDNLCHRSEIPVAGHLTHFSSFWREVIQAGCWVLEIIFHGYSIELLQTPQFQRIRSTPPPPSGPSSCLKGWRIC